MNQRLRPLTCVLAITIFAGLSGSSIAYVAPKHVQHGKKADSKQADAKASARHPRKSAQHKARHHRNARADRHKSVDAPSPAAPAPPLTGDLAAVKNAIDLARKAKTGEATAIEKTIDDPAARRLVEWFILRHPDADTNFKRYAAFIADNPGWPGASLMRRRAEARLW